MRLALSNRQKSYFSDNQFIELEGLLSPKQCDALLQAAEGVQQQRLRKSKKFLTPFLFGRDLWRDSDLIKKHVCAPSLARLATDLFDQKPLRIAYDQLWQMEKNPSFQNRSLQEISCIQGLFGGVVLCLKGESPEPLQEEPEKASPESPAAVFSRYQGNAVYFSSTVPLNLESMAQRKDHIYLMIAYASMHPVYIENAGDMHTLGLKDLGYAFGDVLKEETHPLVYR